MTAYKKGYEDFKSGVQASDNPYLNLRQINKWDAGWNDAWINKQLESKLSFATGDINVSGCS